VFTCVDASHLKVNHTWRGAWMCELRSAGHCCCASSKYKLLMEKLQTGKTG